MTGYAFATAFAAPVEDGMMFAEAARPARQSLPFIELSTTIWEAVAACTVVIRPCLMPNFSLMTLTRGGLACRSRCFGQHYPIFNWRCQGCL